MTCRKCHERPAMPYRVKVSDFVCSPCNRKRRGLQWATARYNRSAKHRACQYRYSRTPKGIAYNKKRDSQPEYKAAKAYYGRWTRNPIRLFKETLGLTRIAEGGLRD